VVRSIGLAVGLLALAGNTTPPAPASRGSNGWRLTCSCGRWVGHAATETQAQELATHHRREPATHGPHVVDVVGPPPAPRRAPGPWPRV